MNFTLPSRSAPHHGIRLFWWFGIYLAPQLLLFLGFLVFERAFFWEIFPGYLVGLSIPLAALPGANNDTVLQWTSVGIYIVHLGASMCATRRRTFFGLMWILAVLVIVDTVALCLLVYAFRGG